MCGTVAAQARNFSQAEASPVTSDSGTPSVRMARHLLVIALEPDLGQRSEAVIVRDLVGRRWQ